MKVIAVESFLVPPEWLFVRIGTDEGVNGWGEAGLPFRRTAVAAAIDELAEFLVGESPLKIEDHWQVLSKVGFFRGGAIISSAVAALDCALWDIAGRHHDVPVYDLLGGPVRDRIAAVARLAAPDGQPFSDDALAAEATERRDAGFSAFKVTAPSTLARGGSSERALLNRVEALRAVVGEESDIAVDCGGHFSTASARMLLPRIEPYRLMFLENATRAGDGSSLAALARGTRVPLSAGNMLYSRWDFKQVLAAGIAVAQPDASKSSGLSETRRIAGLAEMHDTDVVLKSQVGPIALAASLQIGFATPNVVAHEWDAVSYARHSDYLEGTAPELERGCYTRPLGVGLGVDVDEALIRKAAASGGGGQGMLEQS